MKMLILFTVVCCYILYKLVRKLVLIRKQFRAVIKLPGPPVESVIFGHVTDMMAPPEDLPMMAKERFQKYGGLYRLWIMGFPFVFFNRADYAEMFFTDKALEHKGDIYRFLHVWLGLGLLNSEGQMWQQRRKLITPAFHFSILNSFHEIFVNNAVTMIQKLHEYKDGASVDVFMMMHLVALDNICESAMGIKIEAVKNPKRSYIRAVEDAARTIIERIGKPYLWNDLIFYLLPVGRKLTKDLDIIFELTDKAISNRKTERALKKKENTEIKHDEDEGKVKLAFLDLLLEAVETDSTALSDEDIRDEVNTFMFEGHDTTAASMSFTLYLLGLHPEIQENCYKELNDIFQGSDRSPTMADLQNMKYLEQVIKESLRLFPSVPMISRQIREEYKIGDYTLPAGTFLGMNVYNLHRDPKVFPDPEKFDPDRFTTENCASRHPYAYVPFAAGPRNCIGQKFAMLEEKVVMSYILRNFVLESVYGMEDLKILFSLTIRSAKSLDVRFKSRKQMANSSK